MLLAATAACKPKVEPIFVAPQLDAARLSCSAFPEIVAILDDLPAHRFLSGSNGAAVVTDGKDRWVRFDIVNLREAALIRFADVSARTAHFECFDDLGFVAEVLARLPAAPR